MAVSPTEVYAKALAFVDALCKLPRSMYAVAPSGHYGRDYNTLRKLALEVLPEIDDRLLGRYIMLRSSVGDRETCDANFVEIETYARQILEQLAIATGGLVAHSGVPATPAEPTAACEKAYDVAAIRQQHNQAYATWSDEDDSHLRSRFLEGATIDDLVCEFGRQPGGIRSRLRKLGLDPC